MSPAFRFASTHTHTRTRGAGNLSKRSVTLTTEQICSSDSRRLYSFSGRKQRLMLSQKNHQNPRIEPFVCVCVCVGQLQVNPASCLLHSSSCDVRSESESRALGFKHKSSRGENRICNVTQSSALLHKTRLTGKPEHTTRMCV